MLLQELLKLVQEKPSDKIYDYEEWQKAVKKAYPAQANKMRFKGRMDSAGHTISAEVPGEDRCYGVWDGEEDYGQVLSEGVMSDIDLTLRELGEDEDRLEQILSNPRNSKEKAVANELNKMIDEICHNYKLHADDDFEKVLARLQTELKKQYPLEESASDVSFVTKFVKDGTSFSLWQKGNYWYELTYSTQNKTPSAFKSVKEWYKKSLEDIKDELKKDGYKERSVDEGLIGSVKGFYNNVQSNRFANKAVIAQKKGDVDAEEKAWSKARDHGDLADAEHYKKYGDFNRTGMSFKQQQTRIKELQAKGLIK